MIEETKEFIEGYNDYYSSYHNTQRQYINPYPLDDIRNTEYTKGWDTAYEDLL